MTSDKSGTRNRVHFRIVEGSSGPQDVIDAWKWTVEINGNKAGGSIWYASKTEARAALNLLKTRAADAPVDPPVG